MAGFFLLRCRVIGGGRHGNAPKNALYQKVTAITCEVTVSSTPIHLSTALTNGAIAFAICLFGISLRASSPEVAGAKAPRLPLSYIAALIANGDADYGALTASAFASVATTQPPRYLGSVPGAVSDERLSGEESRKVFVRVDVADDEDGKRQLDELVAKGVLSYYEPNYLSKPYSAPAKGQPKEDTFGDVLPRYQDYLNADCGGDGTECHLRYNQLALTGAFGAMSSIPLSQAPVIAVMDSGVDYNHPALAGRLWQNSAAQQGISGCAGDVYGCDTTQSEPGQLGQGATIYPTGTTGPGDTCPPISQQGGNCIHGTHIAGIIAATWEPVGGYAFPGICPSCKVLSVKIVGPTKDGTNTGEYSIADSSIIAGLSYIANFSRKVQPVKVVNASFGKFHASRSVETLLRRLQKNEVLFVAATGNESTEKPSYPAAFEGVIAVANISKRTRVKHENSNYGTWVDISAPGSGFSGIASTKPGGEFIPLIGTSMAAPMVAAVAGLVWAQNPDLPAAAVAERILAGADQSLYDVPANAPYLLRSGGMTQPLLGRGSLNASNALKGITGNELSATARNLPPACGTIHQQSQSARASWWLLFIIPLLAIPLYPRLLPKPQ